MMRGGCASGQRPAGPVPQSRGRSSVEISRGAYALYVCQRNMFRATTATTACRFRSSGCVHRATNDTTQTHRWRCTLTDSPADYATERWNPTTGCGPGLPCWPRCWARRFAMRLAGRAGYPKVGPFRPTCHPDRLDEPLRWRKPRTVAVSFMGDILHEQIQPAFVDLVLDRVRCCPQHIFLFLTKRPQGAERDFRHWPINAWLGVSVEDRPALHRVDTLRDCPAAHRWISIEPQIADVGDLDLTRIDWVVQGCESGPGRRPFDIEWARSVRDQCASAGVSFYLKQMPAVRSRTEDFWSRNGKRKQPTIIHVPTLDGRQHLDLPWEATP